MNGKTVLITGATAGIGRQSALGLAKLGARVVVTGRNPASGQAAIEELRRESGNPKVELVVGDLSSLAGVRALADEVLSRFDRLDVLINNAGSAAPSRKLTVDGLETNFAVNVVAPYLLTHLLLDRLKASGSGRVVTVMGGDVPKTLDLDNLQAEHGFDGLNSYSQSKLAMLAMMQEFAQRETQGVTLNVGYPGQAATAMTQGVTRDMLPGPLKLIFPLFRWVVRPDGGKSAAKASRSSVYLASSPEMAGHTGIYVDTNCRQVVVPAAVTNPAARVRVWQECSRTSGI